MLSRRLKLAAAVVLVPLGLTASTAQAAPGELLPDLDQEAPTALELARDNHRWFLGFGSGVRNVGDGPLVIAGHRPGRSDRTMVADQLVERPGAPRLRVPGVGRIRFVASADHRHWHYIGFDRYELRRIGGRLMVRGGRKSGFCLGDRYAVPAPVLPSAAPSPVFTSYCGLEQPWRMRVSEGISVGYGDYYQPNLEGQNIALQGLPRGRYTLVHRVNADRRLRELRYDNDAASLVFSLRWRRGLPDVRILARCEDSADCAPPAVAASGRGR
jgi:hypothetical protein